MNVMEEVLKQKEYTISMRRMFHRHPELSMKENGTAKRIPRSSTDWWTITGGFWACGRSSPA